MELKFGRLIGEDPKLTLAKIISRKTNPDTSYLEVEESFGKKGKTPGEIVEVPFDASKEKKSINSSNGLNLVRPVPKKGVKFEVDDKPLSTEGDKQSQPISRPAVSRKSSVPNVILRKPSLYSEEDESSKYRIKPNLTLKMGKEPKPENISDVMLLKKPEPMGISSGHSEKNGQSNDKSSDVTLLQKPEQMRINSNNGGKNGQSSDVLPVATDDAVDASLTKVYALTSESINSLLLNKPEPSNLDLKIDPNQESSEDQRTSILDESTLNAANSSSECLSMAENELHQPLQPSRSNHLEEQGSRRAFESWLRQKGVNPSLYKQGLGYDGFGKAASPEAGIDPQIATIADEKILVSVVLADRNSRRLIFSIKAKEKEELVEKKRSLMAKLLVGDVVKCCIQKITHFGIFVEVEGVPALIHQTEVSWDATLDPASYFKIGQIVDAKVPQLDFSLERIFLSLKEITPDPMMEALEAVVGDHDSLNGEHQAAELDTEWPFVESLMKELQQFKGIFSVSKGRYFLSPGLAPTFQVYMASMFENQYKLLARAGNRVQEVIVETSFSKEEMKSAIQSYTKKVE
ncbi:unnamed protein product [Withania somnifera]